MGFWGQNGSDQNFSIPLSIRYGLKNHVLGPLLFLEKKGTYRVFFLVLYHFFYRYASGG